LIEFTVVKNIESAIKNKKSWTKYDYEMSVLKMREEEVYSFYPSLVLSNVDSNALNDIIQISDLLDIEFFVDPGSELNALHENLNSLEYNISELLPELLMNEEVSTNVLFKQPKSFDNLDMKFQKTIQNVGIKRQRSQNIFNRIKRNSYQLERDLKNVRYKSKFKIIVNVRVNTVYIDSRMDGVTKNVLLTLIQNLSMEVMKYVETYGVFDDSDNPFEIYGAANLEMDDEREIYTEETFETEVYENTFYRRLMRSVNNDDLTKHQLLSNSSLEGQVLKIEEDYNEKLIHLRTKTENVIIYNKNPFIFPVGEGFELGKYSEIKIKTRKPITDIILSRIKEVKSTDMVVDRKMDYDKLNELMSEQNKAFRNILNALNGDHKLARRLKNIFKKETWIKVLQEFNVEPSEEIINLLQIHSNIKKKMNEDIDEPTRTKYRNRITIPRSIYKAKWNEEMEHFNQVKGKIKICEEFDMSELKSKFDNFLEFLFTERLDSVVDDIHSNTDVSGGKFSKICSEMLLLIEESKERLLKTNLMHNLMFISRVCYSLLYYSNIKLNKEDFMYDNLGYKNCLLIVKGGKKILSTKKTRLFSLIFPISEELKWLYCSSYSKIVESHDGKLFCVFPWQTFFFPMAKKGTELYFSFSNYFLSSQLESDLSYEIYLKFVSCKVLNMFSQRRKLEIWFGSFRYLYLNSLSTHTSVLELVESMVDHDYDPYFYLMQRLFSKKYIQIYENAKDLKIFDIFTDHKFENFDLCAEKFDETLFMTMAPFDRTNEHLKNLKSVLETHQYFLKNYSKDPLTILEQSSIDCNDDDYIDKVFNDDFKFDPKLVFCIGKFAGNYLKRLVGKETLAHDFTKILQSSYTDISTSKGMRSNKGEFWGKKGHDVLFSNDKVQDEVIDFVKNLPANNKEFRRAFDEGEITFQEKIESMKTINLEFDIKDKNQWKGSREIYVMSEKTKVLQQPLERFFKILCNWTPNELIHKKSHVRPKFIHSQVFEFESGEEVKTYCTLDCRKWAPRSNLWKYYYFILGMQNLLPKEFVDYFLQVWYLMFKKKVRIQSRYCEILKNNSNTKNLYDLLEKREDGDYEITMPYSFMMGIFNYLSSLLHAFSQLYFNEKIAQKQNVHFNLIAHSDDSGGVLLSQSYEKNLLVFLQYEIYQKFCNHLLSKKKSSLSKHFFEIISIMYAKKRLIPMTHKFLGNVSFEPKGKGWVDDISTIVSKIVELFSNGASMSQCYLTMISMSEMIRKFYHLPRNKNLSKMPLAFGGVFNMHPIHLILLGADSQEIMLDYIEDDRERAFRIKTYIALCGDYFPGKGTQVNYKIPYYKRHSFVLDLELEDQEKIKLISACHPKRTLGKKLQHYSQLNNSDYVYSLSGVDMCQIYVMTLFSTTYMVKGEDKQCTLKRFTRYYSVLKSLSIQSEIVDYPKSNFHNYMTAAESINIKMSDMTIRSNKTCKPINYSTFQNIGLGLSFQTINELMAFNSKHDLKFMFDDHIKMETLTNWVQNHLPKSDKYDVLDFLMKLSSKDLEKVRSSYCFLPSGISVDTIERFWTYMNFYSTRRYYVSSKKPQYFTIDQFKLWNFNYDSLKHYYLLLKILLNTEKLTAKMIAKIKENAKCPKCEHKNEMSNMVDEILKMINLQQFEKFQTNLPFATYQTKQYRSFNVWYGQSEFTLHTMFGNISLSRGDEGILMLFEISSEEYIDQVWFLFKNFVNTRGIIDLTPVYSINDTADYKIAFSDLNQPIVVGPGYKGMMIKSSIVHFIQAQSKVVIKTEKGFTFNGDPVDFEIYQNYDINPDFYEKHNLSDLKESLFEENLKIDQDLLSRNILSSKLYKTVMLDDGHLSAMSFKDKYEREGLLGSDRSLTKALMIGDSLGKLRYRSNVNPLASRQALLETQSYKDIPVLDLVDKCSFARLTFREKIVIDNMLRRDQISESDSVILNKIIDKLGIQSSASAITLLKVVFSSLSYQDVNKLNINVVLDFFYTMMKAALLAIEEFPKIKGGEKLKESKHQICKKLALFSECNVNPEDMANYLTKLFLRAQNDNPGVFWENRKDNIYCALFKPNKNKLPNQAMFIFACINHLKKQKRFLEVFNLRQILVVKKSIQPLIERLNKKVKKFKNDIEYIETKVDLKSLKERNYFFSDEDEFDDNFDAITGGEDPENFNERSWDDDNDEESFNIVDEYSLRYMQEQTLMTDYSTLSIYSLESPRYIPWLGYGSYTEEEDKFGVLWHVSIYPGSLIPEKSLLDYKFGKQTKKVSKNIEVTKDTINSDEEEEKDSEESKKISEEKKAARKSKDKKVNEETLMSFESDEAAYEYQIKVLKENGIPNPERYKKYFFRKSELVQKNKFWSQFTISMRKQKDMKIKQVTSSRKMRTSVLPGFSGNLKDKIIKSELKALFGDHVEEIVSGNHHISQNLYHNILMSIKRLFNAVNERQRALLVVILSILKDCIIDDVSDNWLIDPIFGIINELDDSLNKYDDNVYIPPMPVESELIYEVISEYEDYN